ncbi:COMM domain-containing protein 6 [Cololabis saira]|uniref:COMM domain-containing protein 6 n=1 Tax=Cololabis saira TaxID=129043 RepID=UPI002AD2C980|nr:COMM domain-containing protein 6 [Cololabis saira]
MPSAEESHGPGVVVHVCRIPAELLAQVCQHILAFLQGHTSGVDSAEAARSFQRAGVRLDDGVLQDVTRFLLLTFRSAGKRNISADELVSELDGGGSKWSKAALQVLHGSWSEHRAAVHAQQEARAMLSIGQVLDLQWKLGMAVSSDSCRSLNSPYVTLLLKILKPSGETSQRSFEMTIPQFQNFHQQFREMAALLETV